MSSLKHKTISGIKCNVCGSSCVILKFAKEIIKASADLLECCNCGLVFLKQEAKAIHEEDKYWDSSKQAGVYLDENIEERTKNDFLRKLELISKFGIHGDLLDIGCGTGQFLNIAKGEGWNVYGLDISSQAAKIAQEKYDIQVFIGKPEIFDGSGISFDCVTMWDVIEHFTEPDKVISAIRPKIKKGGLLVIRTPNENALTRTLVRVFAFFGLNSFLKYVYYTPHYFYFNAKTLKKLLVDNGFKIVGQFLENTDESFAKKKIQAHYKTSDKFIVSFFIPVVLFVSRVFHKQNKLVFFAKKI